MSVRRHRAGEVEALRPRHAEALETRQLLAGLDTFGRDLEVEGARHRDDGRNQRRVVRIGSEPVDEDAVDLDAVDREQLEIAERRVAGAEVVDRQVDPEWP